MFKIYLNRVVNHARVRNFSSIDTKTYHEKSLKNFNDIPGPKRCPGIGTLYKYLPVVGEYNDEALDEIASLHWKRYGGLVREVPLVKVLHVFEPDAIESVFRQDDRYPGRRSHLAMKQYRLSKPNVYNTGGLLSTNGPEWWRLRSTFQKNFTSPQSVKAHAVTADEIAREFVDWVQATRKSTYDDFLPYLNRLNFEIIGRIAFNKSFNSFSSEEQAPNSRSSLAIEAAFNSNSGIMKLDKGFMWKIFKTPLYRKLASAQEYLERLSIEILSDRPNITVKGETNDEKSLLASFLKQPDVDYKDIIGMMVDILMASIDTTAYSTSFLLYHLARNPECQEKLYKEVSSLIPGRSAEIDADILTQSVYTKCCLKESLRLNPVSVGVGRFAQKDLVIKEYLIPKDTVIVTQNMMASRLPQYVRDPLRFKPERWMRDSPHFEQIHSFTSLPFGFGPRSCIARRLAEQNMCITLMRMVKEFEMEWKGPELGIRTLLINKPDGPISIMLKPRKSK